MTAKLYGFDRSLLHDTTERDPFVIDMVRAEDYLKLEAQVAALQEQLRALAAENADLKDINSWCRTEAFQNMYREFKTAEAIGCADVDCMHDAMLAAIMHAPKTPATDAALREIRAQAVDATGERIRLVISEFPKSSHDIVEECAAIVTEHATRIRAGEQP